MHAGKSSSHALQKTRCAQHAPAGMLRGLPIAAERRAVGWGNGEGAGEGVATSTAAFPWRRARASGEERLPYADPLPDTFPHFPVNGCRSGRESGSLAGTTSSG